MSAFDELADRLREMGRGVALEASPPVERWEVVRQTPLLIEQVGGDEDLLLEEGDEDVEIVRDVLARRPNVGDLMLVHQDDSGWIISGVIGPSSSSGGGAEPGTGDKHYTHTQAAPASVWTIEHGLGKRPSVAIYASSGDEVEGDVDHQSNALLTITFSGPFAGVAYLN